MDNILYHLCGNKTLVFAVSDCYLVFCLLHGLSVSQDLQALLAAEPFFTNRCECVSWLVPTSSPAFRHSNLPAFQTCCLAWYLQILEVIYKLEVSMNIFNCNFKLAVFTMLCYCFYKLRVFTNICNYNYKLKVFENWQCLQNFVHVIAIIYWQFLQIFIITNYWWNVL